MLDRARMHICDHRATLYDRLFVNTVPSGYINRASPADLLLNVDEAEWQKTEDSILALLEHETSPLVRDYWRGVQEYYQAMRSSTGGPEDGGPSMHVMEDIREMLQRKSHEELCKLEVQVRGRLKSADADPDYWQALLGELRKYKTRAALEGLNSRLVTERQNEARLKGETLLDIDAPASPGRDVTNSPSQPMNWDDSAEAARLYAMYSKIALRGNEMLYNNDLHHSTTYAWANKLVPVKPRFFNWCYTRIEWTKYNQAHYNSANPPPPTIQGFSFNIFYPLPYPASGEGSLRTPAYRSEPDPLDPEHHQLVRFIGGPPYEDVLFRIPAKQWELGYKHGFRCTFENSTLTLNFRFKRLFYRR